MHHTGKRNDNNNTVALPYLKSKISGNVGVCLHVAIVILSFINFGIESMYSDNYNYMFIY